MAKWSAIVSIRKTQKRNLIPKTIRKIKIIPIKDSFSWTLNQYESYLTILYEKLSFITFFSTFIRDQCVLQNFEVTKKNANINLKWKEKL